jgi:glycosyltransferase involved in cell wall biosynthesis
LNRGHDIELTILLPCLNEALTVQTCVGKARRYLDTRGINGEVLVADNGSTDGSQELAKSAGASVISISRKGYGAALSGGIEAARGRFVIMADADDSYDLSNLDCFVGTLRSGTQLVVGNRFKGGIQPGAMPLMNRYLGNPALSLIGRALYKSPIGDFHCGIRGFDRQAIIGLDLRASGMEYASEMIVKASLAKLSIQEVPTTLSPDGRQRPPHLRPWRDGWRHLRFMLLRSPNWLFLYPGLLLTAVGFLGAVLLIIKPISILGILTLDVDALLYFSVTAIVGTQITFFGLFALAIARQLGLRVARGLAENLLRLASRESSVAIGVLLMIAGIGGAIYAVFNWGQQSFGPLVPSEIMRLTIPSATLIAIGIQLVFGAFLLGFIEMEGRALPADVTTP